MCCVILVGRFLFLSTVQSYGVFTTLQWFFVYCVRKQPFSLTFVNK